jgi:hypothetical protein
MKNIPLKLANEKESAVSRNENFLCCGVSDIFEVFNVIMQRAKLSLIYIKCGLIPDHSKRIVRQQRMMRTIYRFLEWNRALAP